MKNVLVASFDLEVGGVERSLLSMLCNFNYKQYSIDLMLYSHSGDFMQFLPTGPNLLNEISAYKTFRMPISEIMKQGNFPIGLARLMAKGKASLRSSTENGYKQMQYMWKYSLPFLPKLSKSYDVAISYLWPHYFVAEKVEATKKIAWIHTDYSTVDTDIELDLEMWQKYNHIIAVSEDCRNAFLRKYPSLKEKVKVIENVRSPELVQTLAYEEVEHPMFRDPRFKIITVARLSHAKGIDQAIKALRILKDRGYSQIAWYVVGYGGDEQMLRVLIKENDLEDSFYLVGKQINPYPFMKDADLYVQPSRYEGKAVTVGEAQILGKPVLITNYPTANSQVNAGVDGYICEKSPKGIAEGIAVLYEHPEFRNELSMNCKQIDFQNHEELVKLYQLT